MILLIVNMTENLYLLLQIVAKKIGGIDKSNQSLYGYLDGKRPLQWSKKVIFNLLMRLIMNSYILYKLNMEKH